MNRPSLLAVVVLAILVSTGWVTETICAQQTATARTIGVVAPGFSVDSDEGQAFREGLRAAGYVEGRDVSVDGGLDMEATTALKMRSQRPFEARSTSSSWKAPLLRWLPSAQRKQSRS